MAYAVWLLHIFQDAFLREFEAFDIFYIIKDNSLYTSARGVCNPGKRISAGFQT